MAVADNGANIGYFTLLAATLTGPGGRVYAFEPNPSNCTLIQLSLEANAFRHVDLYPFALADTARLVVLNASASTGSTRPITDLHELGTSTVLRAVPLDDLMAGVRQLDVLKIDIDGGEGLAMRGALNTLKRFRPIIFTEFSPELLRSMSGVSGEDYLGFLLDLKYEFSVITFEEGTVRCGTDTAKVMDYFHKARASHVDLLVTPR
jgi:FkbM family methyltransferase